MAEYSVMDRINMIISDPDHATMTLAQIVTEEIREFKASEQYANMIQAEAYYRNRTDVQRKTNDVANRSNTRIEHPILKKLVDQKANYLLGKPFTVDTKNSSYGDALNDVFDQTFRRKIKSLGKGAVKSGIAWLQPYFDDGKLAFMRIPSAELVPIWRDAERTKLDAFIRFYDRMEKIDTASTAAAWSTGAKGIANNLSQITGKLDSLTSSWDVSRSTGTINGGDLDSVGSVGKIDSDVNIADEDLKFLRDVAEMRYVQNFVTLTPTVAMDAQISERVDLDDVVSAIERKLEGEFIAAAEGVYN